MTVHYTTIYRKETGEIVSTGLFLCEEEMVDINFAIRVDQYGGTDHDSIDAAADPDKNYVATLSGEPTVVDRPPLGVGLDKTAIAADGEDYATLTGLPDPCTIIIDDPDPTVETTTHTVAGGGFEFEAATPGVYTIEIRRFPFLPLKVEITAT
jgi:hypothetical protein